MKLSKLVKVVASAGLALSLVATGTVNTSAKETKTLVVGATTSPHAII